MPRTIEVLYDDDDLVVFNKPSGLLVIPSPREEQKTLVSIVNASRKLQGARWHPCHRLDRDTSGLIIFAKSKSMQQAMREEFRRDAVEKKYIAFVRGRIGHETGEIAGKIRDYHQRKFAQHSRAKKALTRYKLLARTEDFSVVEAQPITGRTNQIRIHFHSIGYPLLGERLYAFGKDFKVNFRRLALHARSLAFRHPVLKKQIRVLSPLPGDMEKFLEKHSLSGII